MKKFAIVLTLTFFILQSCTSQATNKENSSTADVSAPIQVVADNLSTDGGSINLTKNVFLQKVWDYENTPDEWKYKGDKPALIDFYADWCGPCKIASPILDEISTEYADDIYVYKIDTEVEKELAAV